MLKGFKHSEETKKKMSLLAKHHSRIQIAIKNLPKDVVGKKNGFFGKHHSDAWKKSRLGIKHPTWKGGNSNCIDCGIKTTQITTKRCRQCYYKLDKKGENNKRWKGGYENKLWHNNQRRIKKLDVGGSHSLNQWEVLKKQYHFSCPSCNQKEPKIKLTRDHIVPLIKGGTDDIENIQPLCRSCNSKKHDKIIIYEPKNSTRISTKL